jgi:hypothetical protein
MDNLEPDKLTPYCKQHYRKWLSIFLVLAVIFFCFMIYLSYHNSKAKELRRIIYEKNGYVIHERYDTSIKLLNHVLNNSGFALRQRDIIFASINSDFIDDWILNELVCFKSLLSLKIISCKDEDLTPLLKLPSLKVFLLPESELTSVKLLTDFKNLDVLNLQHNSYITKNEITMLQIALPNCKIVH